MSKLTDADPMPFGAHKGRPMEHVPASYLLWIRDQDWITTWPDVLLYIDENWDAIVAESEECADD